MKLIVRRIYRNTFADMTCMENGLKRSDLDWTVIRAPMLTDGLQTGRYRTAVNQHLPRPERISRADLADYIVTDLDDPASYRAKVEVAY